ncbi:MAG: aminotransferase class V-fold PLP-dependent enzyme [Clostridia bacterium]|nr:aminotransferase class V-fold PLP-dependent enzyme [Clostridia bacterium]
MIYFRSDYSQGAHPDVLMALSDTNSEHTDGYGIDRHCDSAAAIVRKLIKRDDAHVHFMIGGTNCNVTMIASSLKPYETVIAARSGHAYFHETGAVEATGHRVTTAEACDGKLTPEGIEFAMSEFQDEHTPKPAMVYISQPTEIGTVYSKAELTAIRDKCKKYGLIFYIDGARLGAALTCSVNDTTIEEIANLCDAFYIGGTKCGALFGEALVILNDSLNDHFRWMIKRQCGMLAKGRLIGVQFEALLGGDDPLYFKIAKSENETASLLRDGLAGLGVEFLGSSPTNQIFPILPDRVIKELENDFFFYVWGKAGEDASAIRLVTGWGTTEQDVDTFLNRVKELI